MTGNFSVLISLKPGFGSACGLVDMKPTEISLIEPGNIFSKSSAKNRYVPEYEPAPRVASSLTPS